MAKDDGKELRKVFERYEKILLKAANSAQSETPCSYKTEFFKRVDEATQTFKQNAQRVVDKEIPDANLSTHAEEVLRKAGAIHETANVKLTTYVQMVSKLTASADEFKDRIQARIDEDKKKGITTTVSDLKGYINDELRSGRGIAVTYSNGAQMPTDKYAEMLSRTTRMETQNISMLGKALDDGNDLVECSTISPTCPTCAKYQGRIYSITGKTPGYPALFETAFRHGYSVIHPNCRHQFFPYNPKFHTAQERADLEKNTRRSFDGGDPQSESTRAEYARSQMLMRQWNKELNEFAEMRKRYGKDAPYQTLGSFRRAYRSEEGSLPYAKTHYYCRDTRELERFTSVLGGGNVPQTLAEFQELKYNKDSRSYVNLQVKVADELVRRKLGTKKYPLDLHMGRQGKHIKGHNNFQQGKSYLAVDSVEEGMRLSSDIVQKYHGKGSIQRNRNGDWKYTERVITDKVVGYVLSGGQFVETNAVTIHYSKDGTHIVPTIIEGGKQQ